jgi:ATP-dependent helicase YprA (DUF1998 family)
MVEMVHMYSGEVETLIYLQCRSRQQVELYLRSKCKSIVYLDVNLLQVTVSVDFSYFQLSRGRIEASFPNVISSRRVS